MCSHGRATILHADVDAFYASVEQQDDPRLRGRPVIVGAGVVLAASYEAKAYGVRTHGRPPGTAALPARDRRPAADGRVLRGEQVHVPVFEDATPLVEGLSIDEAFLDVRGMERLAGTPTEIAARLRRDVREHVGLPISIGVARTKFLAKVASGVSKPDGLLVVSPHAELEFLHPLPVGGCGASAPSPRRSSMRGASGRSARLPACRRRRSSSWLDGPPAASSTRSRTIAIAAACRWVADAARSGRSARSGAAAGRTKRSTRRWSGSSTASRGGCVVPGGSGAPSSCGFASTTSRVRPDPHASVGDRGDARRPRHRPGAPRRDLADDPAAWADARRRLRREPRERRGDPARPAARRDARLRARRGGRRDPRPLRLGGDHARRPARARPGFRRAAPARLTTPNGTGRACSVAS